MKKKIILSAIMSIVLCVSLIAGATFAIFTSESKVNIAVTSGKVKVVATIGNFKAYSPASISAEDGNAILDDTDIADNTDENVKVFGNGGTAKLSYAEDGTANIELDNVTPGDKVSFTITVKNYSNVKVQYRTSVKDVTADLTEGEVALYNGLKFTVGGMSVTGESVWQVLAPAADAENGDNVAVYECTVELPATAGNDYQGKKCVLNYLIEAVQGNAKTSNATTVIKEPVEGEANPVTAAIEEAKNDSTTTSLTMEVPTGVTASLESGVMSENSQSALKIISFVGELDENGKPASKVDVITDSVYAEGGNLSYQRGADSISFKNIEIQAGEGNFDGIVCKKLVYENCVIRGKLTFYANAVVDFINCVFENDMANQYSIWTWGASKITLEGCTFNTNGKAVLLYGQRTADNPTDLIVNNCVFNDRNNGSKEKAAIEIGDDYNATYSLTIDENTKVNGFADGKYTGSKIWANKNKMDAAHLTVVIAGISQYSSLEDAFGLKAGSFSINSALAAGTVLDGKGKVNIYFWADCYVVNNLTIKGVTFANGATFNVKNSNVKFSVEDCTFYACDQDKAAIMLDIDKNNTVTLADGTKEAKGNNGRNNILTNSGAGMCLNLEQSTGTTGVDLVVKNCEFIGENDKTLSAFGDKYNNKAIPELKNKKRGHAIALNAISGGGTAGTLKSLLIEGCVMGGLRGNAIQLYGSTGEITIKDTKINSWAVNDTNIGYAIRGDYKANGNRKLTLTNVYYGLDEIENDAEYGHVKVGEFAGNTDGKRAAGTY